MPSKVGKCLPPKSETQMIIARQKVRAIYSEFPLNFLPFDLQFVLMYGPQSVIRRQEINKRIYSTNARHEGYILPYRRKPAEFVFSF